MYTDMENMFRLIFPHSKKIRLTEVQKKVARSAKKLKRAIIVASCGRGKTEASYYTIIKSWKEQWKYHKFFYVLPQKMLTNSLATRLTEYNFRLGINEPWYIQHSSIPSDPYFDRTYIVTTIDQVLSGFYGIGREAYMKGREVVRGAFVFDEVQLLEPGKALLSTIYMLEKLYEYGNPFLIMTATMPQGLIDYLAKKFNMEVIIADEETPNREVVIEYRKELPIEEIKACSEKQIIICNTQAQIEKVVRAINEPDRVIVLNNKLLSSDRRKVEEQVIQYFGKHSSNDHNKILVASQIIEAGMDISAPVMYSVICPIDSLIQRAGRVVRWGGKGRIVIFELEGSETIYDIELLTRTLEVVQKHSSTLFSWKQQKEWVNEIMDPYYQEFLSEKSMKKHRISIKKDGKEQLIRDIDQVSIIVDPDIQEDSPLEIADKESVSEWTEKARKYLKGETIYRVTSKGLQKISASEIETGDTIIYNGKNSIYDEIGFRFREGGQSPRFYEKDLSPSPHKYEDYIEEPWILHAKETRKQMKKILEKEQFHPFVLKNLESISFLAGLHDIGKLDKVWQQHFASYKRTPLAHFPFKKGINPKLFENRNHALISAVSLQNILSHRKLYLNILLQHHKRWFPQEHTIYLKEYEFVDEAKEVLKEYGLSPKVVPFHDKHKELTYENDVMNPLDKDWVLFVYLVGTLMKADRLAIEEVKRQLKKKTS